ncbi:MAG TPA: efflux RND transporter permease subunit, partial [Gemmatimonadales bacterium]|nr:efflux RND transporter permease subunit [Gemmatimonadales bacterium]
MTQPPPPPPDELRTASLINRIVAVSLRQRFLIGLLTLLLVGVGVWSFSRLPVDAYPDLSPTMVEVITQWPGHAAEEVERLITVPLEVEMNGLPRMQIIRSISLYGLSDVVMTFADGTDDYFARQQVFERLPDADLPQGVSPSVSPLFSPSGLVYRYVVESPDRSPMELKIINEWVIGRQYKAVPGVADESPLGGETFQYQVLLDPTRLAGAGLSVADVESALAQNNGNAGGGFYAEGGQFYYIRGLGRLQTLEDIGNVVLANRHGVPILVKDVGQVVVGHAPRLGQFGFNQTDDAVEGVILMRKGEQAQTVLKGVAAKTRELNESILPKDVKVHAYYDRSDLIALTTHTVEGNLARGIILVLVVLVFFLYDVRSALIVGVTIPLSLLFAFLWLDLRDIPANLLSIGAIDFGILVDSAVIMVENIHRQIAARYGTEYKVYDVIVDAAAEVDRPIFYSVAVIVAGFLPIYVLSGPSGKLFKPTADTMIFALVGSLLVTLTLLPMLCAWLLRRGIKERRNPVFEWIKQRYERTLDWCLARPRATIAASGGLFALGLLLTPAIGAEFMPH